MTKMKMLSKEELNKLPTPRLLNVLKRARVAKSAKENSEGCECCGGFICIMREVEHRSIDKFQADLKVLEEYYHSIKDILKTRENV